MLKCWDGRQDVEGALLYRKYNHRGMGIVALLRGFWWHECVHMCVCVWFPVRRTVRDAVIQQNGWEPISFLLLNMWEKCWLMRLLFENAVNLSNGWQCVYSSFVQTPHSIIHPFIISSHGAWCLESRDENLLCTLKSGSLKMRLSDSFLWLIIFSVLFSLPKTFEFVLIIKKMKKTKPSLNITNIWM